MAPDAAMTTPLAGRWSFAIRRTVLARLCCGVAVLDRLLHACCVVLRCRGFRGPRKAARYGAERAFLAAR